ncbi:MAG: alpha-ketoglutarate decarboxylase [Microbacteriaceae bacterium]|nr:alpha-ketoglutarate decarboxylase [Microbacteriaceae bacterium]
MSDCGCEKARLEMEEYLRHELCTGDADAVRAHLEHCGACQSEAHVQVVITEVVRRSCRDEVAPDELRMRVLAALRERH